MVNRENDVQTTEIRTLLCISRCDTNNDHKISLQEFKNAQDKIEVWVGKISAEEAFEEIDSNHGGSILFDEFCKWAIKKHLDLEDDDE